MTVNWKLGIILAVGTLSAIAVLAGGLPHYRVKPVVVLHSERAKRSKIAAPTTMVATQLKVIAKPLAPQAAEIHHVPLHYVYLDPHQDELNRQAKATRLQRQQELRDSQRQQAIDAAPRYCELHGELLKLDTVLVGHGLPSPVYCGAARKWFPHAEENINGGCMVTPDAPQTAPVLYCQKCRDAEDQWRAEETARINQLEAELEKRGHL